MRVVVPLDNSLVMTKMPTAHNAQVVRNSIEFSTTTQSLMFYAEPGEWAVAFRATVPCDEDTPNPPPAISGVRWRPAGEVASEEDSMLYAMTITSLVFTRSRADVALAYFNGLQRKLAMHRPGHQVFALLQDVALGYMRQTEERFGVRGLDTQVAMPPPCLVRKASTGQPSWR